MQTSDSENPGALQLCRERNLLLETQQSTAARDKFEYDYFHQNSL